MQKSALIGTIAAPLFLGSASALAGDGGMTGRGRTALLRPGVDGHVREARLRQIAADQCHVVVAVRRARHEAWWIIWKKLGERVGHFVREHVFLDPVPCAEQKSSIR